MYIVYSLIGGLEHFFPKYMGIILPTDEIIFFRGVGIPPTSFCCLVYIKDDSFFLLRGSSERGQHNVTINGG